MLRKVCCSSCFFFDFDFISGKYVSSSDGDHFCGLHDVVVFNPDVFHLTPHGRGTCGYTAKSKPRVVQLTFNF